MAGRGRGFGLCWVPAYGQVLLREMSAVPYGDIVLSKGGSERDVCRRLTGTSRWDVPLGEVFVTGLHMSLAGN